jgi:hypothetical protein
MQSEEQICQQIVAEYEKQDYGWTGLRVTKLTGLLAGGARLAVVKAKDKDGKSTDGEICMVTNQNEIRIFGSTEDLAHEIMPRVKTDWFDRVFSKHCIAGVVTLVLLVILGVLAFFPTNVDAKIAQSLIGAFGVAVGFFFGTTNSK